jgi:hypothetical protein
MNLYQITNARTGANHLTWAATTEREALENMAHEAGFEDFEDWCGDTTIPGEIVVSEIGAPWGSRKIAKAVKT